MNRLVEELREFDLDRLRPLRGRFGQHHVVQNVLAAASIPIRTAQTWVARYRQSHLSNLPREEVANSGPHRDVSVEVKDASRCIDFQVPPIPNGRFSLQGQNS